jgi:predicted polyphosphate/ATP-dependent NAD kinase
MAVTPVGIIANPASGKDIRRLVAHASVFDNQEKRNIVRRAIMGAVASGAVIYGDYILDKPEGIA